ncbi:hypothetical protein FGO68_gene292 [Halteria grandinella]|uniref:Uncharacterized protein n=1 Tax=Halteria grandinella TaxID=5974 RepID=A0A8J8NIP6_HALGN|nr:hypothetical protein FGO68_gene292 [Halteria grandinella]
MLLKIFAQIIGKLIIRLLTKSLQQLLGTPPPSRVTPCTTAYSPTQSQMTISFRSPTASSASRGTSLRTTQLTLKVSQIQVWSRVCAKTGVRRSAGLGSISRWFWPQKRRLVRYSRHMEQAGVYALIARIAVSHACLEVKKGAQHAGSDMVQRQLKILQKLENARLQSMRVMLPRKFCQFL